MVKYYLDGKEINAEPVDVTIKHEEIDGPFTPMSWGMKEMSFTFEGESNLRSMSDRMRIWCKMMKWNGNIYL